MTTVEVIPDLVSQVAELRQQAISEGKTPPGRPALIALTGATEHQIRKVLAILDCQTTSITTSTTSTSTSTTSLVHVEDEARQRRWRQDRWPLAWPLMLIGCAAAVAVWSGWVGLGELTGFGPVNLLPGIGHGWTINSAIVLPLSVEAYGGYAMRVWLSNSPLSGGTKKFARNSAIASLATGMAAQVAYHLMTAADVRHAPWPITTLVACVSVVLVGLAAALARLVANDRQAHRAIERP